MIISALAFAYSGFALFCASSRKPNAVIFKHWLKKPRRWVLKGCGIILLIVSLLLCMTMWGSTVGFAAWWIVSAIPAYGVVLTYTYFSTHYIVITSSILGIAIISTLLIFL